MLFEELGFACILVHLAANSDEKCHSGSGPTVSRGCLRHPASKCLGGGAMAAGLVYIAKFAECVRKISMRK